MTIDRHMSSLNALVTGGAGFIGSALVHKLVLERGCRVTVYDKLTYAGRPENLRPVAEHEKYRFIEADILDGRSLRRALDDARPAVVFHLAAESHVDRSIDDGGAFLRTNVEGTGTLLDACLDHYRSLDDAGRAAFHVIHVSTDEVFGTLGPAGSFDEDSPYRPNSPYSASKAASDMVARAYRRTYGLPVTVTNCSNNYGPRQFPEKLIPLCLTRALSGETLPVFGKGLQVRDWLYVDDHADALIAVAEKAEPGGHYCIGGGTELPNIELVGRLCALLDDLRPRGDGTPYRERIEFVADRPGHDFRYSIDTAKIERELGWRPGHSFDQALKETVDWYLGNEWWLEAVAGEGLAATGRRGLRGTDAARARRDPAEIGK